MSSSGGYWLWDYGPRRAWVKWMFRGVAFAGFFIVWELVGRSGTYFAVAPATTTMAQLVDDIGRISVAMLGTLRVAAAGYIVGVAIGLAIGSLVGLSRIARSTLDPLINAGVVTPMTMLVPVIGIYVGLGMRGKLLFVFVFVVFVVAINTSSGVASSPVNLEETANAFGLTKWERYRKVVFPSALPLILTGLRLAAGRAVQGAIIADLLLEVDNIGRYLIEAGSRFDMPRLLAGTFFTVVVAAAVMLLPRAAERRLLQWMQP